MTTLSISAGCVAYGSGGRGGAIPVGGNVAARLAASPAVAAAELASLASTAFDGGTRTNDTQDRPPATKEKQQ